MEFGMLHFTTAATIAFSWILIAACSDGDAHLADGGNIDATPTTDIQSRDSRPTTDTTVRDSSFGMDGEQRDTFVVADAADIDTALDAMDQGRGMDQEVRVDAEQDASVDPCENVESSYVVQPAPPAEPPFGGTLFVHDGIIIDEDPTSFRGLTYAGQGERIMYDRRTNAFENYRPHLFNAQFGENKIVEVQVNPEMSREEGEAEATKYCRVIGQIPGFLFRDLDTVWLHRGDNSFGGGNRNLLIHTEQGERYIADGLLGEVFLHEAAHTSVDAYHQDRPSWLAAQAADGQAISRYAADFPRREDLAETLPLYLAVRFYSDRLPQRIADAVLTTIPNRIRYLDCQHFDPALLR